MVACCGVWGDIIWKEGCQLEWNHGTLEEDEVAAGGVASATGRA
jgi:hypothetical protein